VRYEPHVGCRETGLDAGELRQRSRSHDVRVGWAGLGRCHLTAVSNSHISAALVSAINQSAPAALDAIRPDRAGMQEVYRTCDLVGSLRWLMRMNHPGFGGGIDPTKGWSHVSTEEVSA
jgi:hypothetical protein